ncbi:hypothetical protein [Streptomyces fragilis]|uniref:hypothetical protein n=1 Tax=Streptomyces fragilis TaxID=67301 RepID=UPI0024DDFD20|nr:hypothetical protein [Streptomyces fragilis]
MIERNRNPSSICRFLRIHGRRGALRASSPGLKWRDPVSYTHLDVYKRQIRRLCQQHESKAGAWCTIFGRIRDPVHHVEGLPEKRWVML